MVTSRDIFQPTCGHFQSCNKGQGDTMDEMTTNFYIKQSRVMVVGRMTTGSVCDRQQKETAIMAMVTDLIEFF